MENREKYALRVVNSLTNKDDFIMLQVERKDPANYRRNIIHYILAFLSGSVHSRPAPFEINEVNLWALVLNLLVFNSSRKAARKAAQKVFIINHICPKDGRVAKIDMNDATYAVILSVILRLVGKVISSEKVRLDKQ